MDKFQRSTWDNLLVLVYHNKIIPDLGRWKPDIGIAPPTWAKSRGAAAKVREAGIPPPPRKPAFFRVAHLTPRDAATWLVRVRYIGKEASGPNTIFKYGLSEILRDEKHLGGYWCSYT